MRIINIRELRDFRIGNAEDQTAGTGCTAIVCQRGAMGGVDVRGCAPASRETDLLDPVNSVEAVHCVILSGGSAFGLDAAAGAMQYLEERNIGVETGVARVPIVVSACLFDLGCGDSRVRPDRAMGYRAMVAAENNDFTDGNSGAGCGCTVGKLCGPERAMKGGLAAFACQEGDLQAGAVVAVNCLGNVVNDDGQSLAGPLSEDRRSILSTEELICGGLPVDLIGFNTTIACILTNAALTKPQTKRVAMAAHDGLARAIRPAHTSVDGDSVFALSVPTVTAQPDRVAAMGSFCLEQAIHRAILSAESAYGILSARELQG